MFEPKEIESSEQSLVCEKKKLRDTKEKNNIIIFLMIIVNLFISKKCNTKIDEKKYFPLPEY